MPELLVDAIIDFCNAVEAACVKLKHDLGAPAEQVKWTWDPSKMLWENRDGGKGPYQVCCVSNADRQYQAMLGDLQQHKGRLNRDGTFYWVFQDGSTVARKTMGKEKP